MQAPKGWSISPESQNYALEMKGQEQMYSFEVSPPKKASDGDLSISLTYDEKVYRNGYTKIEYDHIPTQIIYPVAKSRVVRLDIKKKGELIGYIRGAGDAIPENLTQIGYKVEFLSKDDVNVENLVKYDAVILGVRALNTTDWLSYKNEDLFEYVEQGGTLIVQYTTNYRLVYTGNCPLCAAIIS